MEISAKYDPSQTEDKWYAWWLEHRCFHSEPDGREPYVIVIPPPHMPLTLPNSNCSMSMLSRSIMFSTPSR